jgi:hypothetical protein
MTNRFWVAETPTGCEIDGKQSGEQHREHELPWFPVAIAWAVASLLGIVFITFSEINLQRYSLNSPLLFPFRVLEAGL